ncbi:MAG: hypothetical protein ACRDQZ_25580 [Mycobacteriales bacterium]
MSGDVLGYVTSTTPGPYNFILVQYPTPPGSGAILPIRCASGEHVSQINADGTATCSADSGGAAAQTCTNQFLSAVDVAGTAGNCKTVSADYVDSSIALASQIPQANPTPGASGLISGGGVSWTGGLNFTVSPAVYGIAGTQYSSPQSNVTLDAADPTDDRIDVIAVDNAGAAVVIKGTAGTPPASPDVDPNSQIQLTFAYVAANATTPSTLTEEDIYLENAEWTCAATSNLNCASTNNPFSGTKDIEATSAVSGNNVVLTRPTLTVKLSDYNNLVLYVRSKAAWPNAKSISISWLNGTTKVGVAVGLKTGVFGFSSTNTSSYQQIVIPVTSFNVGSGNVSKLSLQVAGGGAAIGYYIDNVYLQGGVAAAPVPVPTMLYRGAWTSSATYNANDVVLSGSIQYVALLANTNSTPTNSNANWATQGASNLRAIPFSMGVPGSGSDLDNTATDYTIVPFACNITAYNLAVDAGTITVKFWKIARGTAIPTVSNSISTSGVSISTGTAVHSTTLSDFTATSVAAGDVMAMNVTAASGASYVLGELECIQ